jgi:hypothetical protein
MSRWLALYLNLVGHPPLTDGDTSRHTDARANGRPHADDHSPSPVCHDLSPSVSGGRSRFSAIQSSLEAPVSPNRFRRSSLRSAPMNAMRPRATRR